MSMTVVPAMTMASVPNQVTVRDLHRAMRQREDKRVEGHALCTHRCYNRIKKAAAANNSWCVYDVPEFIIGVAPYDLSSCVAAVMRHLGGNGFDVQYVFPRTLIISWEPPDADAALHSRHLLPGPGPGPGGNRGAGAGAGAASLLPSMGPPLQPLQPAGGGPGTGGQPGRMLPGAVDRTMLPPPLPTRGVAPPTTQNQEYQGHGQGGEGQGGEGHGQGGRGHGQGQGQGVRGHGHGQQGRRRSGGGRPSAFRAITEFKPTGKFVMSV
jgi:hypothetical protein